MADPDTMLAAVFNGPFQIDLEQRPVPTVQKSTDAIVKVSFSGICGSELHMYRGNQKCSTGHIMGHEFTGTVHAVGSEVRRFKPGQVVVSAFAPICNVCWMCEHGYTNRCIQGSGFGTPPLNGGHAEYVRVPAADGTLHSLPAGVKEELAILMADIFPTGYYGATRAILELQNSSLLPKERGQSGVAYKSQPIADCVFVCIGCGPVGLCAILVARMRGVGTIFAVDSVEDRLDQAQSFGAVPLNFTKVNIDEKVKDATNGRGADCAIEVVGNQAALKSAFQVLRPCGVLMSLGFHHETLPFGGFEAYSKNLNVHFGRAPVGTVFEEAFEALHSVQDKLEQFISHRMPLSEAPRGFAMFEKQEARKVVLVRETKSESDK